MMKNPRGTLYKKNNRYYVRVYYYVNGQRKSKDFRTGITVTDPSKRKEKQNERAANQKLAEILNAFVIPGEENNTDKKDQMFTETVHEWLAYQSGCRAPSTISSYQYIACYILANSILSGL